MSHPILVVDQNEKVHHRETEAWNKYGIDTFRVENMNEAMEALKRRRYLCVSINADNINYLPMLPVMRKATNIPILVITSNFTIQKQLEALHNGARTYAPFEKNPEDNVRLALAKMHQYAQEPKPPEFLIYDKLFLLPDAHQLFFNGLEIYLPKKEFELLYLLLTNRGIAITTERIIEEIWQDDSSVCSLKSVNNHVSNLRRKLSIEPKIVESIKTIRGVGYRFDPD